MLTDVWKLDPRKVALIKNPLDFDGLEEVITPIEHPYFRCGVPVFLAAGRLCRQKNYKMMLNAFALARARSDVRLIVLGEGELRPALEQRIRALRLEESVDLVGFVPDPLSWMRRADCYLLSSLWEGSPLALIEAMSVGLAIVATNCESGPKELLEDYPMGRLTPVGDAESFARAMLEVLEVPRLPFDVAKTFADRQPEKVARAYLDLV